MKPYTFDLIPVTCLVAYTYYPGSGSNFDQPAQHTGDGCAFRFNVSKAFFIEPHSSIQIPRQSLNLSKQLRLHSIFAYILL